MANKEKKRSCKNEMKYTLMKNYICLIPFRATAIACWQGRLRN